MDQSLWTQGAKLILSLIVAIFLTACGLQPFLAEPDPTENPQKFVVTVTGAGYGAYKIRRELEKSLVTIPKLSDSPYDILIGYSDTSTSMSFGKDATVVRNQTTATGTFQVTHQGDIIGQGSVQGITSYPLNYAEEFSTRSAANAARERAIIVLAEELTREILMAIKAPKKLL